MGDPKKQRKKYRGPSHPWEKERIELEKELMKEYGLKNKKEIWKMISLLRDFSEKAKKLVKEPESKESKDLLKKLIKLGLINEEATIDDVLSIPVKKIMERRLQTLVFRKGMANTIKQARQMIVHGHIKIGNKKITFPSYIVKVDEEDKIKFNETSPFNNPEHTEIKKITKA